MRPPSRHPRGALADFETSPPGGFNDSSRCQHPSNQPSPVDSKRTKTTRLRCTPLQKSVSRLRETLYLFKLFQYSSNFGTNRRGPFCKSCNRECRPWCLQDHPAYGVIRQCQTGLSSIGSDVHATLAAPESPRTKRLLPCISDQITVDKRVAFLNNQDAQSDSPYIMEVAHMLSHPQMPASTVSRSNRLEILR